MPSVFTEGIFFVINSLQNAVQLLQFRRLFEKCTIRFANLKYLTVHL